MTNCDKVVQGHIILHNLISHMSDFRTPFAERKDEELFQIDREADIQQKVISTGRTKKLLKPLKCFAILDERSAPVCELSVLSGVHIPEERPACRRDH